MMHTFFQKIKRILLPLAVSASALLLPLHFAQAQSKGIGIGAGLALGAVLNPLFIGIPYVVGYVGGLLLSMVSHVVNYLFYLNTSILPDTFGIIEIGYAISLSVANTILVIALIVIAFATILNVEEYTAKKKLGQVISTAVLINFGLLIVGVLLDLSHVITKFFLSGGSVGTSLGGALGPQRFLDPNIILNNKLTILFGVFEQGWFNIVGGVIMLAIFTWALFIVMCSVGGMFIWRYIKLVGLIIVLPFAWALALLPGGSEKKKAWWHDFIQAAFFLPGAAFFIYLAIEISSKVSSALATQEASNMLGGNLSLGESFAKLPQMAMQLLVVIGILMYGLKQAQEMGGEIAQKGISLGRKLSDRVVSRAERATRKGYSAYLNAKPTGRVSGLLLQGPLGFILGDKSKSLKGIAAAGGSKMVKAGKNLETGTGRLGSAGKGLNIFLGGSAEDKNALESLGGALRDVGNNYEEYTKRYTEMDHGKYEELLKNPPTENATAMNALMKLAAERGDMNDLVKGAAGKMSPEALAEIYKAANPDADHHPDKDSTLKALALSDPEHSDNIVGQDTEKFLSKLDGGEVQKLSPEKFAKFADLLSHGQLMAYARKNGENEKQVNNHLTEKVVKAAKEDPDLDPKHKQAAQEIGEATEKINTASASLKTLDANLKDAEHGGDKAKMKELKDEISGLREDMSKQAKARNKLLRSIVLTKDESRQSPEFAYALKELTEAARNIGGTGSREKASESHHARPPESVLVNLVHGKDGGGGGGHGAGHH